MKLLPSSSRRLLACLGVLAIPGLPISAPPVAAQAVATASTGYTPATPDLHISPVMGPNFTLDYTAQHNSATGWANIVTPDLSWRFNRYLSVNASVPWYASVKRSCLCGLAGC